MTITHDTRGVQTPAKLQALQQHTLQRQADARAAMGRKMAVHPQSTFVVTASAKNL